AAGLGVVGDLGRLRPGARGGGRVLDVDDAVRAGKADAAGRAVAADEGDGAAAHAQLRAAGERQRGGGDRLELRVRRRHRQVELAGLPRAVELRAAAVARRALRGLELVVLARPADLGAVAEQDAVVAVERAEDVVVARERDLLAAARARRAVDLAVQRGVVLVGHRRVHGGVPRLEVGEVEVVEEARAPEARDDAARLLARPAARADPEDTGLRVDHRLLLADRALRAGRGLRGEQLDRVGVGRPRDVAPVAGARVGAGAIPLGRDRVRLTGVR